MDTDKNCTRICRDGIANARNRFICTSSISQLKRHPHARARDRTNIRIKMVTICTTASPAYANAHEFDVISLCVPVFVPRNDGRRTRTIYAQATHNIIDAIILFSLVATHRAHHHKSAIASGAEMRARKRISGCVGFARASACAEHRYDENQINLQLFISIFSIQ